MMWRRGWAVGCGLLVLACPEAPRVERDVVVLRHPQELPPWAVPYGQEPWRQPAPDVPPRAEPGKQAVHVSPSVNLGDVMERVGHAIQRDEQTGTLAVHARTYWAAFDAQGFVLSPHRPGREPDPDTQVAFRTLDVVRGGETLHAAGGSQGPRVVVGNTAQTRLEENLLEHLEARADGVEITWVLNARPRGTGDLEMGAELVGLSYAGATQHGLHFADGDGVARVRVGNVVITDAQGHRWTAAPEPRRAGWRIRVPDQVLQAATYPLAVDPTVGPEFEMDAPVWTPAANDETNPHIAAAGSRYLVVWSTGISLSAARVDHDGGVVDVVPLDLRIAEAGSPAVASNGVDFLVVWQAYGSGEYGDYLDIHAKRVRSADGAVMDGEGGAICTACTPPNGWSTPAVASNGTDYLVVWVDSRHGFYRHIHGTRMRSADGTVMDASGLAIGAGAGDQTQPAVASNGTDYLVVWGDFRNGSSTDIYGTRVRAADGSVVDTAGTVISEGANGHGAPAVASNGTDYLVVWGDGRGGSTTSRIYGSRVQAADGSVVDAAGIAMGPASGVQTYASVASNGMDYLVAWTRNVGISSYGTSAARVRAADGAVLDTTPLTISAAWSIPTQPAVASNGTDYLVVWAEQRSDSSKDILGTRIRSADGAAAGAKMTISTASARQYAPAVASNGTDFLVVWEESWLGSPCNICGTRLRAVDGTVLDASALVIRRDNAAYRPAVASNGTDYLVVWEHWGLDGNFVIHGTRVHGADGSILDGAGLALSHSRGNAWSPVVASNGVDYLVVWDAQAQTNHDVYGTRVRAADGTVVDAAGIAISTGTRIQRSASVASNGTDYLVVWQQEQDATADILGTRVQAADGRVVDGSGMVLSTGDGHAVVPAVASNGTDYLVVWISAGDIYGTQVRDEGDLRVGSRSAISTAAGDQSYPSVASNGTDYLVVWVDSRSDVTWEAFGARVRSTDGALLDGPPDTGGVFISPIYESYPPLVAFSSPSRALVVYEVLLRGAVRAVGRLIDVDAPPVLDPVGDKSVLRGDPLAFTVTAWDPDGDALTYSASNLPAGATFNGETRTFQWTPGHDQVGTYPLVHFAVSDGLLSASRDITITVTRTNAAPRLGALRNQTVMEGALLTFTVNATDPDADPLTYSADNLPVGATFVDQTFSWTPGLGQAGTYEHVRFAVSDGMLRTSGEVTVVVTPFNRVPAASSQEVTLDEDGPAEFELTGTDPDGDALGFTVVTLPSHGQLQGTAPTLRYVPAADFFGDDALDFTVHDGTANSPLATVSFHVRSVNDVPVALPQRVEVHGTVSITLVGTDADGDGLNYRVAHQPEHGALTGTAPALRYQPRACYAGADFFTFTVSDGVVESAAAQVDLDVLGGGCAADGGARDASVERDAGAADAQVVSPDAGAAPADNGAEAADGCACGMSGLDGVPALSLAGWVVILLGRRRSPECKNHRGRTSGRT